MPELDEQSAQGDFYITPRIFFFSCGILTDSAILAMDWIST